MNDDDFMLETRLSGALIGPYGAIEVGFDTEFPTWIIAYCPDTDSWFCTNRRFFYYEYPEDFPCEKDAVNYFLEHVDRFIELNNELYPRTRCSVFLENLNQSFVVSFKAVKI